MTFKNSSRYISIVAHLPLCALIASSATAQLFPNAAAQSKATEAAVQAQEELIKGLKLLRIVDSKDISAKVAPANEPRRAVVTVTIRGSRCGMELIDGSGRGGGGQTT